MVIDFEHQQDVFVLRVAGRFVTGADSDYVRRKTDEIKSHNCAKMLVDLHDVTAIGSMGIGFLVGMYVSVTKTPGGRFVLVNPSPRVREALQLTRLTTVIPMVADLPSALAVLHEN